MKNKGRLLDAVIGLALTLFVAGSYYARLPLLESVEFKAYDLRAKLRQDLNPPPEIVIVAIDDDAIAQIGRWPWPRTRLAAAIDKLNAAGPKVIGLNVLFSEAEQNQGLLEVKRLEQRYKELVGGRKISQRGVDFALEFSSSAVALDSDSKLLASLQGAGNVVLPLFFTAGTVGGKPDPAPASVSSSAIRAPGALASIQEEAKLAHPILAFSEAASGVGHVNLYPEVDGVLRREAPFVKYGGELYPSYAMRLTMAYLGLKTEDLKFEPGVALTMGKLRVPLDGDNMMPVTFNGPQDTIRVVPFASLMSDKPLAPELFKDKIVIIGPTATGIATLFVTPVAQGFPSMEIVANVIENVLHSKFLTRPVWAEKAELGLLAFIGIFLMAILPRLKALWGLVASILIALGLFGAGTYLFVNGQWLKVGYPAVLLFAGYIIIISKSFLITEKGKELVEASAIETNKMLGLSFQGQGMLDIAFEKFRLCPLDDNMKDTLYNLALDFERKRQYSKAAAVLEHVAAKDPKYKDSVEKAKKLKEASDGAVFGGVGAKKEGTVMLSGGATKPTLGRYEIEKELGRGAMGVVYLGRDPKINRMVAIKTMSLEEGSDGESAKSVKERFFREAESAGTLNHPNIVRIFDAGEENDVAYIAMELLDGHDLVKYGSKEGLLPFERAIEYVATVADALDYAHAQGIVHRDIKPANVMLLKDGSIRVADFGIARITASSKTATGTVMGTPSYMSPEQVAGKKVDGRSDLFSLAVALYELTTGEKPFKGGDGIGTLLFQIANDPHPDVLSVKPDLPAALRAVIDKGLAKNPDERFQRGSEFAAALRAVLKAPAAAAPAPKPAVVPTAAAPAAAPQPVMPEPKPAPATERTITAEITAEMTAPPKPAPKPAPAPDKTAAIGPEITAPLLSVTKPAEKTIGPEITIPGLNDLPRPITKPVEPPPAPKAAAPIELPPPPPPPPPSDGPMPANPSDFTTMAIEPPQHGGVGPALTVPPPPPPSQADPNATMRIERTQSPDATIRIKPHPQEPA